MSTTQVLIAGAGPAGLVAAITLAMQGVSIRVIDKATASQYQGGTRGSGIQVSTLMRISCHFLCVVLQVLIICLALGAYSRSVPAGWRFARDPEARERHATKTFF
jgi:glycine/D-amino acid oxidase-like deaminating enzyme